MNFEKFILILEGFFLLGTLIFLRNYPWFILLPFVCVTGFWHLECSQYLKVAVVES
jgi:hypothetical protein